MSEKVSRKEQLEHKRDSINAKLARLRAKEQHTKRKEETRVKILLGAALLSGIKSEQFGIYIVENNDAEWADIGTLLNTQIQSKRDRDFLQSKGMNIIRRKIKD